MPNVSYTVKNFDGKNLDLQLKFVNPDDLYKSASKYKKNHSFDKQHPVSTH